MLEIMQGLQQLFKAAFQAAYADIEIDNIEITRSTQAKFGHYQCNSAMQLTKSLKQNPRTIAEAVIKHIVDDESVIEKLEIAGPGFINITLTAGYLQEFCLNMLRAEKLGFAAQTNPQRVVIDFSSPNIAKEMHVGHLRSTIIGDCIARVLEYSGYDVVRLNHIGDWGTAFGMLIAYLKQHEKGVLDGSVSADLTALVGWYKKARQQFDADEDFKRQSQLEVVALQGGDENSLKAWQIICDISRCAYQEIYDLLNITIIERGESFYNPFLAEVVADLQAKEVLSVSDGAKCIFLKGFTNREGEPLPLMVQKSDGGYNYATTDMAAIRHRITEEKADRIIYVTDLGQGMHFKMVFAAAEKAGYLDSAKVQVDHAGFGLVLGADGKKFKTRSGETERLIDLLTTAIARAKAILQERHPDWPSEEINRGAKVLGMGAIKYADLSGNRNNDYRFSYDKMLRFEGNTAAFILYSYVRVKSIQRKVKADIEKILKTAVLDLQHPSEIALALQLVQFSETLKRVSVDLLPNRLTDYLFDLAEKFNAFFRDCHVDGSEQQDSRLLLAELVARVLKTGLTLLGIETLERM